MGNAKLYQILVVEDDENILDWYVECLDGLYRVVAVHCGRDAIERVKRKSDIDLAVIDYRLPAPSVPVIIVTGYGDEDLAVEAFRSGARDYLKKPFSTSEFLAKIDFYLNLRSADKRRRKNTVFSEDALTEGGQTPHAVTPGQYRNIQLAVRFINDNYHRTDIHLEETARIAGMSPSHFSRMFRKVMGLTYQEYLGSRRIAKAQNLLRNSILSVSQVAQAVGYSDITGFGRTFRKLSGHTPTAYRNLPRK